MGWAFENTAYYNNESNWEDGVLYIGKHLIGAKDTISGAYTIKPGTLTIAGAAFVECSGLTSIEIPDSVTCIGEMAFNRCSGLTGIKIPDSVEIIGDEAFEHCSSLTSIELPNRELSIRKQPFDYTPYYDNESNWEDGVLYIGKHLIRAKDTISGEYTVKQGTLSIGAHAFQICSSLTSIEIPRSVTIIERDAFHSCSSLTTINYSGTVAEWQAISMGSNWKGNTGDFTVVCTDGTLSKSGS